MGRQRYSDTVILQNHCGVTASLLTAMSRWKIDPVHVADTHCCRTDLPSRTESARHNVSCPHIRDSDI